jgi:hypothetical protein
MKIYPSCFISFSFADIKFATKLYSSLKSRSIDVWFSPHDMKAGQKVISQISHEIGERDKVILLVSENSINSNWVETEIRKARQKEVREGSAILFPVRLCEFNELRNWELFDSDEGRDLAVEIREYYIPDFSRWQNETMFQLNLEKLVQDLKDAW